ncbi:MAG: aspartate dehydrogenase [Candidatus Omnitrophica bacterium]|nr:aspartate dehydrogenase [Candidatus Omnitrophota bacterium]
MHKKIKIGIVGCGAVGTSLAKAIKADFPLSARIASLCDIEKNRADSLSQKISGNNSLAVLNIRSLISRSKLVIECASSLCSWDIAKEALNRGRDIMIMSAGGLISRLPALTKLADKHAARVYIPSGAISGIDALKAAKVSGIKSITLTTRKHPLSFKGVKYIKEKRIALDKIRGEKILFSGAASEAVKYFPQNINVAAVLSMAGIGENKTRVRIIADNRVKRNIHEIRIVSKAGDIITRTENLLHPDNPKTSYLAVLAAVATLKQIFEPVRIGT